LVLASLDTGTNAPFTLIQGTGPGSLDIPCCSLMRVDWLNRLHASPSIDSSTGIIRSPRNPEKGDGVFFNLLLRPADGLPE
jgi:hypothetical protein